MAVSISRSLRMPLSLVVRSVRHRLPELGGIALRVNLEDLALNNGLFAVTAPVIDHRILMPDHVERNHVGVRRLGAIILHRLGGSFARARLAALRGVALPDNHHPPYAPLHD